MFQSNPSSCTNCNIALPNSAEISYKMSKTRISGSSNFLELRLEDNNNHIYFVGNWSSGGENGLLIRNSGSSTNLVAQTCTNLSANIEYLLGITYNNGEWTYFKDNEIKSFTANYTPTILTQINITPYGTMKDLKIKPL